MQRKRIYELTRRQRSRYKILLFLATGAFLFIGGAWEIRCEMFPSLALALVGLYLVVTALFLEKHYGRH